MTQTISRTITCTIAQLNASVGDIEANVARVLAARTSTPADILLAPEMMVTGYQLDDLVQVGGFFDRVAKGLDTLKQATSDGKGAIIVGAPRLGERDGDITSGGDAGGMINNTGKIIYNSVFVFADGKQVAVSDKARLALGGVFDDARNFTAGSTSMVVEVAGVKLGLPICEDFWSPSLVADLVKQGAEVIMTINGSPFELGKTVRRHALAKSQAAKSGVPVIYVNLIGGQDDVVFDGASFAVNPSSPDKAESDLACQLPHAEEAVELIALHQTPDGWRVEATKPKPASIATPTPDEALLWEAICLGISDYVRKNNFSEVVLGLSGGIDSAVVATLAADALGADKVHAVMMPSPYTSRASLADATALANNLGIHLSEIAITPAMHATGDMLAEATAGYEKIKQTQKTNANANANANTDPIAIAQENIQSRLRGIILMALSNMSGGLVLTTGNKSEYASGYATLYGDMCGGYAPLIDVWKTQVFALAEWRNQQSTALHKSGGKGTGKGKDTGGGKGKGKGTGGVIPSAILTKPPTAELRPDQKDSDSLPPYPILDKIMGGLVEEMLSPHDLIARGHDKAHVLLATALLKSAEFKRRQCAPGPKMSKRAFYRDRRFPITSAYNSAVDIA
ncbi:MAG: NAD+ synthase [Proteobacteria bacterium]|nr:NAD+ synthase [Pseudomonadota bacterium]